MGRKRVHRGAGQWEGHLGGTEADSLGGWDVPEGRIEEGNSGWKGQCVAEGTRVEGTNGQGKVVGGTGGRTVVEGTGMQHRVDGGAGQGGEWHRLTRHRRAGHGWRAWCGYDTGGMQGWNGQRVEGFGMQSGKGNGAGQIDTEGYRAACQGMGV